ncbi:NUDIX domain-containing protein [Niveispirillum sp. BGYR6]|uniref:NUDIX domain-containing protein n=1 Tax=Niveispirillum sp. BGYR6 TaxID=2971249 RepID=UPI0022B95B0E|nr:NUDIX domain-containing protein [Niveispirillum sp. BGYR6]MDG5494410.1 NUDIX domain-containing protein [Niveispirillum sp. BGYR6]
MTNETFPRLFPVLPGITSPTRVEIVKLETIHKGFMDFTRQTLRHERFGGDMTPVIEREICHRGHAVAVVLYDPARDVLLMIEQFRAGALAAKKDPWLLEFVAGMVKPDEVAAEVAARETEEEAGCTPRDLQHIFTMMPSPGGCTEIVEIFFGYVDTEGLGGLHGLEEEVEDIRVHLVPADLAIAQMDANRITSGFTLLGLAWFARHHAALKAGLAENALQG